MPFVDRSSVAIFALSSLAGALGVPIAAPAVLLGVNYAKPNRWRGPYGLRASQAALDAMLSGVGVGLGVGYRQSQEEANRAQGETP